MSKLLTKKLIDRIRILVESGLSWEKIAAAVGVSKTMLHAWKQEGAATYDEEFAAMVKAAVEDRDTGAIKAGQFEQAVKHVLVRKTRELQETGPQMPPSWFPKDYIVDYAEQFLNLVLDPRTTANQMRAECFLRVKELSKVTMVVAKTEEIEVDPNQAAVKNVLSNTGPKNDRWSFKEGVEIEPGNALTKLLNEIGQIRNPLPSEEDEL